MNITFTFILQMLLFLFLGLLICYVIGYGVANILQAYFSWYSLFALGFVTLLGCLEIFGWFCVAFRMCRFVFELLMVLVTFGLFALGIAKRKSSKAQISIKIDISMLLALAAIIIMLVMTWLYYRPDADDSFYVSNVTLFANSTIINPYDSSFGIQSLGTVPMYDFQIWELFMAIISNIFHLEAVTMMHTVCLPWLLLISSSAFMLLGDVLTKGNVKKSMYFFTLLTIFHLFGGYAVYSEGSFLLSRIWQGKAVYLNVVLPVMIALILSNIRKDLQYFGILILLCVLTGIALNPTSMYVMGFELLFMTIVLTCINRKKRYLLHIIPSILTVIFFTLMIYLRASKFDGQIEAASSTTTTFVKDTFLNFFGTGKTYILLYIIAIIIIALLGDTVSKVYTIYTPLALLLSVWNPWLGRLVAEHVTMVPSYWRVFWLIPFGPAIILACLLLYERAKKFRFLQAGCLLISVAALSLPGKWMFTSNNLFIKCNNVEKIPDEVISFGEIILLENNEPVILSCDAFSTTLRQKYTETELIFSRYQYILDLFLYRGEQQQAEERTYLMNVVNGSTDDYSRLESLLQKYCVDYVITKYGHTNLEQTLKQNGWQIKVQSPSYQLYSR